MTFRIHLCFALFAILILCAGPASQEACSQFLTNPQPGDIYKEFSTVMSASSGDTWRVTDPNINLSTYPRRPRSFPIPRSR